MKSSSMLMTMVIGIKQIVISVDEIVVNVDDECHQW